MPQTLCAAILCQFDYKLPVFRILPISRLCVPESRPHQIPLPPRQVTVSLLPLPPRTREFNLAMTSLRRRVSHRTKATETPVLCGCSLKPELPEIPLVLICEAFLQRHGSSPRHVLSSGPQCGGSAPKVIAERVPPTEAWIC